MTEQYRLPLNRIIRTGDSFLLTPALRQIESELADRKPFWQQKVHAMLELLLLELGRQAQLEAEHKALTPAERRLKASFTAAREVILKQYASAWTLSAMAALTGLSPERFGVLYLKYFKLSPKEELISRRIEESKVLLVTTADCLDQIATACGFKNVYYFSRMFKQKVGIPPGVYRNRRPSR